MRFTRRRFIGLAGALGLASCARVKEMTPEFGVFKERGPLTFAAINDVHVLDMRSTSIVNHAVQQINADDRVQFTVILGDIATDGAYSELSLAKGCFDRLRRPYFSVPGNHDVFPPAKDIFGNYSSTFGDAMWRESRDGWVFIGLDSCEGSKSDVHVQPNRLEWLDKQLGRIKPGRPIALFAHHPFNPNTKAYRVLNADDVLARFEGHNLKLVAAGHYHGNQVEEQGGVLFTTTACCSTTRNNFDNTAEKGYRLFHLTEDAVETEFVVVTA